MSARKRSKLPPRQLQALGQTLTRPERDVRAQTVPDVLAVALAGKGGGDPGPGNEGAEAELPAPRYGAAERDAVHAMESPELRGAQVPGQRYGIALTECEMESARGREIQRSVADDVAGRQRPRKIVVMGHRALGADGLLRRGLVRQSRQRPERKHHQRAARSGRGYDPHGSKPRTIVPLVTMPAH